MTTTETEPATLEVFVAGKPAPQGSIRAIVHRSTGRAVAVKDNNATQKSWRGDVRDALIDDTGQPKVAFGAAAMRVQLEFVMPRPVSTPKSRTPHATKKPDVDKLERAILDAVTSAGVWNDDSQVVDLHSIKRLAEIGETPGCRIRVEAVA